MKNIGKNSNFVDWLDLAMHKSGGEFAWISQRYIAENYLNRRSIKEINKSVLTSDSVQVKNK